MDWYEERSAGLGQQFLAVINAALEGLSERPERFAPVRSDVRRVVLRRFPYLLFFVLEDDEVVVLTCIHERRSPDRWPSNV